MPQLPADIDESVRRALAEDMGGGDLTADLIAADAGAEARIISRQQAVVCGRAWVDAVFRRLDSQSRVDWQVEDGARVTTNQTLCHIHGKARALLSGERTALNFLQTLSGTATVARRYADAIAGTKTRILDTRKTIPGLRNAQKYAVACGGCTNHRMGLYDAILIKENHILAAGSISAAIIEARRLHPNVTLEIEVETVEQVGEAIAAKPDILLLDNMSIEQMREVVRIVAGRAKLEASGGITFGNIRAIAETGVDFISVGVLTKDLIAVDLSMRFL
jgi:nicotinate-nucleotide pyrophosphorylase (carboxylating)